MPFSRWHYQLYGKTHISLRRTDRPYTLLWVFECLILSTFGFYKKATIWIWDYQDLHWYTFQFTSMCDLSVMWAVLFIVFYLFLMVSNRGVYATHRKMVAQYTKDRWLKLSTFVAPRTIRWLSQNSISKGSTGSSHNEMGSLLKFPWGKMLREIV